MKISVIIPSWNGKKLLETSLPSINIQSEKELEVIIIDNGSTDGSIEYIESRFPHFSVIQLKKNIGFAPAVNIGIKKAKGEYIFLLNNDTKVDKNCIKALKEAADNHQEAGIIAAKLLQFANPQLIDSAGDLINILGQATNRFHGLDKKNAERGEFVFLAAGGGMLIKRWVFEKIGIFDEDYFAYFEDVDFSLRAQLAGIKIWFEPKAIIYHIKAATAGGNLGFLNYYTYKNMHATIIKDFPGKLLKKNYNWLKIILNNLNTFWYLSREGYFVVALKAEISLLVNVPSLLIKRKAIQSQKKVTDEYIIDNVIDRKIRIPVINYSF